MAQPKLLPRNHAGARAATPRSPSDALTSSFQNLWESRGFERRSHPHAVGQISSRVRVRKNVVRVLVRVRDPVGGDDGSAVNLVATSQRIEATPIGGAMRSADLEHGSVI